MPYTRAELLAKAVEIHDREVGQRHCDRKYLDCCHVLVNSILKAPKELDEEKTDETV